MKTKKILEEIEKRGDDSLNCLFIPCEVCNKLIGQSEWARESLLGEEVFVGACQKCYNKKKKEFEKNGEI